MGNSKGLLGNFFSNEKLLWFIILFLLLFWCFDCHYKPDSYCNPGNREDDFDDGIGGLGLNID